MKLSFFCAKRACLAMALAISFFILPMSGLMAQSAHMEAPAPVTVQIEIEDVLTRTVPPSGPDIIVSPNPATTYVLADPDSGLTIYELLILDDLGTILESENVSVPDAFTFDLPTGRLLFRFDTSHGIIDKWVVIR